MNLRMTLGWLIPIIFSMQTLADELNLKPAHPEQYQVIEGDSLWSVADQFLENPSQWPKLWKANPQIKNPNLIYPGDVLGFAILEGKPQVSLVNRGVTLSREQKLSPQIHEHPLSEAIKLIPANAIAQYLSSPKVVAPEELKMAPYVLEFTGEHLIVGAGDKIYVRSIPEADNALFTIYRQGEAYISPETKEVLGYAAIHIADATLQKAGEIATLVVNKAKTEIRAGDRLMPNAATSITLNYFPRPPEKVVDGNIIGVMNGVSQIGQYNIVVIDKGTADGLIVGHVLDIFQRGKLIRDPFSATPNTPVMLPEEISGSLMLFRVFDRVSYALVMQANQSIHVLDKVRTP